ncbi:uncharacterized protein EKO05_0000050 [Ascochyta rabiei]|uniref:DUF7820 domain-containing protein n=1 Tax=Didymella rabiei TaxID=5454 RepID=A0A163CFD1_DIDRA|nr:uncharacterized protein EKO05_0000050 [Ascochyta rabiei]KZM22421.1 hypothetical protein ST47_g6422 [Ascochyta rabiei]UPX09360.1 hypothetical protein EKO05_0000050 [Ascochyta rabiei]
MQLPRRSVRSIQELPSIYTVFPPHYKPVRTHSASTFSDSARSPDIEDGLEVVPLELCTDYSALSVSACLDEKEVFIMEQREGLEKPLPSVPKSAWGRTWGRMSVKYRVLAVLGLQALLLLTVGIALLAAGPKRSEDNHSEIRETGSNETNTATTSTLERGTFMVPIQFPQQQSSKCLARANESRAWQCAFDTMLQLSILPSQGEDADEPIMITLGLPSTSNRSVHCGQQAPEIGPTALVALDGSGDEAQYRFSAIYSRTVILREDQLGQEKTNSSPMQGQPRHTIFQPGLSLWRCRFNDTRLEGSIYAEKGGGSVSNVTDAAPEASRRLPYKLQLLEQRVPATGSVPYCERVVVGVDGGLEERNEKVSLEVSDAQSEAGSDEDQADTSCQCQWLIE